MMIKGRYVATVEIDFSVSEKEAGLRPFNELKEKFSNETTKFLTELIEEEFYPFGNVSVTQQYADVFRCDEQEEER